MTRVKYTIIEASTFIRSQTWIRRTEKSKYFKYFLSSYIFFLYVNRKKPDPSYELSRPPVTKLCSSKVSKKFYKLPILIGRWIYEHFFLVGRIVEISVTSNVQICTQWISVRHNTIQMPKTLHHEPLMKQFIHDILKRCWICLQDGDLDAIQLYSLVLFFVSKMRKDAI